MWKCSILDGKFQGRPSPCSWQLKPILFFIAFTAVGFMATGLMAQTGTWSMDATFMSPDESEVCVTDATTTSVNLSAADYEAAEAQGTCPVLGMSLSGVETIAKICHNGREFYVCHPGCVPMFMANPDRYMANLQGTCPVCGAKLVDVDSPCKFTYRGQDVYVRDEPCKKMFLANPDKYLKNLPKESQP